MDESALLKALQRYLTRHCEGEVRVENLRQLAGGASREMFAFDLRESGGARVRELVLRLDPPPGRLQSDRSEEYRLLAVAYEAGVKVPAVRWLGGVEDGLGARFIIMDRVSGEAIGRRLARDRQYEHTRRALPRDLARELARIHAIDLGDPRLSGLQARTASGEDPRRFARLEIERYRGILEAADGDWPRPALRLAARWLDAHAPTVSAPAVVHGDFRIGNVMFDEHGLTAVLDWELAHVGDPMEDVGWMTVRAWRFGRDDSPVGGLCSREEFWRLYGEHAGTPVDPASARWWEIFGNWKWAIICIVQAASYKAGRFPNIELASLGRRVAEVEWELVTLIERQDAGQA